MIYVNQTMYERVGHEWLVEWFNMYYGQSTYWIVWQPQLKRPLKRKPKLENSNG